MIKTQKKSCHRTLFTELRITSRKLQIFILKLFFAFGIAFEIPVATVLVIKAGMTTRESLAQKRPYIVVMCFIFGMLLTPPDMISQSLLAIPTWLLFEMGLFMSGFIKAEEPAS